MSTATLPIRSPDSLDKIEAGLETILDHYAPDYNYNHTAGTDAPVLMLSIERNTRLLQHY